MRDRTYRWAVVFMLWWVCLLNYADRQAITAVFDPIKAELVLSDEQLGVIGSAFMWVYAVALPFAGLVGDRVSRKLLVLGGLAFWSAVTLATAFAQSYWQLVACRALEGLGEAFYFPASLALISDYHRRETRSRAMALHQSSVYVGTVVGSGLAGFCAERYGWRSGFWVFGGAGLLLAGVLAVTLKEPQRGATDDAPPPPPDADPLAGARAVLSPGLGPVILVGFVGTVFVGSVFLTWLPTYVRRTFGLNLAEAGLTATLSLQTGSVVGAVVGGWLADWLVVRTPRGRLLVQGVALLLGAPLILLAGYTRNMSELVLALAGVGLFKGMYDANTWATLYDVVPTVRRSSAQGFMNGAGWFLGGATAPIAVAVAARYWGFGPTISAASALYVATGLVLLFGAIRFLPRTLTRRPAV